MSRFMLSLPSRLDEEVASLEAERDKKLAAEEAKRFGATARKGRTLAAGQTESELFADALAENNTLRPEEVQVIMQALGDMQAELKACVESFSCRLAKVESRNPVVPFANSVVPQPECDGLDVDITAKHVDLNVKRMLKRAGKSSPRCGRDIRDELAQYLASLNDANYVGVRAIALRRACNIVYGMVDDLPPPGGCSDCWGPWLELSRNGEPTEFQHWICREISAMQHSEDWYRNRAGHGFTLDEASLVTLHFVLSKYDEQLAEDLLISLFQRGGKQASAHRDIVVRAVTSINTAMTAVLTTKKKRRRPTDEMALYICALVIDIFFAELDGKKPDLCLDIDSDPFPLIPFYDGAEDYNIPECDSDYDQE